jgi:hypothetical protein
MSSADILRNIIFFIAGIGILVSIIKALFTEDGLNILYILGIIILAIVIAIVIYLIAAGP